MNFGVITFYKKQVDMIAKELVHLGIMVRTENGTYEPSDRYRELVSEDGHREEKLRIGTVDAFQGKEFDVVFLSMVRSNNLPAEKEKELRRKFGHLMSPNRLCVSMSRQKKLLIVVGDKKMLETERNENPILPLKNYYELCKSMGVVINE
jgi:superfamily I DNA and/or RNA helicase